MNKRGKEKTGQEKKKEKIILLYFCTKKVKKKEENQLKRGWLLTCLIVYLELLTVACITLYIC